jgi:hypothetical protein
MKSSHSPVCLSPNFGEVWMGAYAKNMSATVTICKGEVCWDYKGACTGWCVISGSHVKRGVNPYVASEDIVPLGKGLVVQGGYIHALVATNISSTDLGKPLFAKSGALSGYRYLIKDTTLTHGNFLADEITSDNSPALRRVIIFPWR